MEFAEDIKEFLIESKENLQALDQLVSPSGPWLHEQAASPGR